MIRNLGKALSILASAEADEIFAHEEIDAFHAPSECHGLVSKGEAKRTRQARRHAEAVAGAPLRTICKEAEKRAGFSPNSAHPRWQTLVGRIYNQKFQF